MTEKKEMTVDEIIQKVMEEESKLDSLDFNNYPYPDRPTLIGLGIDQEIPFPMRKRPYTPTIFSSWTINKHIADYVGILPAMMISKLFEYREIFLEMHHLDEIEDHPFAITMEIVKSIAFDMGISEQTTQQILNSLGNAGFLVMLFDIPETKYWKKVFEDSEGYAWYTLNEQLMNKLFFNQE